MFEKFGTEQLVDFETSSALYFGMNGLYHIYRLLDGCQSSRMDIKTHRAPFAKGGNGRKPMKTNNECQQFVRIRLG
jgi:hypothetical protein